MSARTLPFLKMHGLGNDYVYIDARNDPMLLEGIDPAALAREISDRRRGAGSDGLIVIDGPTAPGQRLGASARMVMFNADGSAGEMCGNGVRCVAWIVSQTAHADAAWIAIEVGTQGARTVRCRVLRASAREGDVEVQMGEPAFGRDAVGARDPVPDGLTLVSMGNHHAVSFVASEGEAESYVRTTGDALQRHPSFPDGINVHGCVVLGESNLLVRTWERGSGWTFACGSGACAAAAAAIRDGRTSRAAPVRVEMPGGALLVHWPQSAAPMTMTGPATLVYCGTWEIHAPERETTR